jgi:glycopeptide antibiotics resistance protein
MPAEVLSAAHYRWLAAGTLALAVYGSLIPFNYQPRPFAEALAAFQHIAFLDPADLGARGDWVLSVALFTALSYLLMAALCVDRRRAVGLAAALVVVPLCAGLSVVIEFVQVYFPPRTVSLNDIAVETLGGLVGALFWLIGGQRVTDWVRRLGAAQGLAGLARRLLPGYLAVLLVALLMPFDFTLSAQELARKYEEGKIWLLPFAYRPAGGTVGLLVKNLSNMACFFPVGFLKVLAVERGRQVPRGWWPPVLLGLGVAGLVEFLQLFVYSRFFDMTDVLTGTAAVCLGWWSGAALRAYLLKSASRPDTPVWGPGSGPGWHPALWAALFLAWLGGVIYFNWRPFDFTTDPARFTAGPEELPVYGLRRMSWLPLVEYYWGSKYQALDQFLKKTCSFMPLGILAALSLRRLYDRRAVWRVVLAAAVVAVTVEAGQYFLPSRSPDVTDVLLGCCGAWLGFLFTRRIRVLLWAETALHGAMDAFCRE